MGFNRSNSSKKRVAVPVLVHGDGGGAGGGGDPLPVPVVECPRLENAIPIVGMLHDCPIRCLVIDDMVADGGTRPRYIRDGVVLQGLKTEGFIDGVGYLKVVELHWTTEEWEVYRTDGKCGANDDPPTPLMILWREVNLICCVCLCFCVFLCVLCVCVWVWVYGCVCVHERILCKRLRTWTTSTVGSSLLLETTASVG